MNVFLLTCLYPTKDHPIRGLFIRHHASAIKHGGNNVVVLVLELVDDNVFFRKYVDRYIDENGIETHVISIRSKFYKWLYVITPLLYFFMERYFVKIIQPFFKVDIVHSNIINPSGIIGYWISKKFKKPHVITEHWSKIDNYMRKNIFSSIAKKAYNNAKTITVVSEYLKEKLSVYVSDPDKIVVIPNIVDSNSFKFTERIGTNTIVFTTVARWDPPKLPILLFKTLNNIHHQIGKKIILNVVGEGTLLNELKKSKWDIDIRYLGSKTRIEIGNILQQTDFFLHASDVETFSIVVAEALVSGIPVVASEVGALPELVNESNGILCDNTVQAWQEAILKILKLNYDRNEISNAAVKKFHISNVAGLFNKIYSK